jgi:pimeloyl-ACP methyl ester carboxylesterase
MWDRNVKALTDSGFQVLRFDLYGRGLSDRPRVDYDLDLFVDQTDELLEALKVDYPIHIVGLSMGGPIAAAYTDRHSTHVRSLTLIDPVVSNIFLKTAFPMNVRGLEEFVMTYIMMPFILPKAQCDDFYHPEAFPDWEARFREQMQYKGFRRAILSTMRCMSHEDMLPIYRSIGEMNIPTLIFHGDEDATISADDIELLRSLVPQNHFYAIPEAGHIPQYEQAEKVNPILINFLQANDQKTTGD